ncbi:MAG: tetratricopeptide repeat protein [Thermoplasmata archaeon]|nr:tetratricopeptide repeat protein [Thermoplasmata archaeon]
MNRVFLHLICLTATILAISDAFGDILDDGNRLYVLEEYEQSLEKYLQAASEMTGEKAAEAAFLAGRTYQRLGQWDKALSTFDKLVERFPESRWAPLALVQKGESLVKIGKPALALEVLRQVQAESQGADVQVRALYNIANISISRLNRETYNPKLAFESYRKIIKDYPQSRYVIPSYYGLGECCRKARRYDEAIKQYQTLRELNEKSPWAEYAAYQIAGLRAALGQRESARRMIAGMRRNTSYLVSSLMNLVGRRSLAQSTETTARAKFVIPQRYRREKVHFEKALVYLDNNSLYADDVVIDCRKSLLTGSGNVEFTKKNTPSQEIVISSGNVTINVNKSLAIFEDDVELRRRGENGKEELITAEKLRFHLKSGKVIIEKSGVEDTGVSAQR